MSCDPITLGTELSLPVVFVEQIKIIVKQ